jgi:transcriptional regulator with XRE-family HTH domain
MSNRSRNSVDVYVGGCVRMRRLNVRLSQEALADKVGLTFQQIQKYEKGVNRISASRLQQFSDILGVPVTFFFDGAPQPYGHGRTGMQAPNPAFITEFLGRADSHRLIKAFLAIKRPTLRRAVVRLIETIANADES